MQHSRPGCSVRQHRSDKSLFNRRTLRYLINREGHLNWSILVNFCHDIVGIGVDSVSTETIMLRCPPHLVPIHTLPHALRSRICRLTTRVRAANVIKVWVALPRALSEIIRGQWSKTIRVFWMTVRSSKVKRFVQVNKISVRLWIRHKES